MIYHIVTLDELKSHTNDGYYRPSSFEKDHFIHCTAGKSTSLVVLDDYFLEIPGGNTILILEIDPTKLKSEIKYEAPAPIQGSGTSHLIDGILFPHVYGGLNIDAVVGVGKVERVEKTLVWPAAFDGIEKYL